MKKNKFINKIFGTNISFILVFVLFLNYIYFVNLATFNTSKNEKILEEISYTQSKISQIEFEYIQKTKSINNLKPEDFGLVSKIEDKDKLFVKRPDNTRFTFNER